MKIIELEKWTPSADDSRKREYAGQRTAQEVFEELKHRLEIQGYLPDEYFLLDSLWEDGREIPKDANVFCTADYGGSEGVYLDAYIRWPEYNQLITRKFFTGKTLGENGNDLDRMFLISSAITKAFHGDHATHARYMKIGGVEDDTGGSIVHLSQQEQRTIINALVEQRERQENTLTQTEQLLRRMTGSITAYINEVGMRPLHMSDYDKAVLAIRDGEMAAFSEYSAKVPDQADALLVEAAGRPGLVGRNMTAMLLNGRTDVDYSSYCDACKKAIDINDPEKALFLLHWAEHCVPEVEPSFYGEMASYSIEILQSEYKDWNEDIKARHGLPAQAAEEHPQLIVAPEICGRIGTRMAECTSQNRLEQDITSAFQQYERNICVGRPGAAMDQIELASALALSAYNRELRQMGELRSTEELVDELQCRILPHRNRGNLKSRRAELAGQLHSILERASAPGIRSKVEKQELADSWLDHWCGYYFPQGENRAIMADETL